MYFDNAGNTFSAARRISLTSATQTFTDFVGSSDLNDFYRFSLSSRSSFNLTLDGLTADADVQVIRDVNLNGVFDGSREVIAGSYLSRTSSESIKITLDAGEYFIRVFPYSVSTGTKYNLSVSAQSINTAPTNLQFGLSKTVYSSTEALAVNNALVYDANGATDINRVDFKIKRANGTFIDTTDVFSVTPRSSDNRWGSFNYSLNLAGLNLVAGDYSLWAVAYDKAGAASNIVEQKFTILPPVDLAGNTLTTARSINVSAIASNFTDWVGTLDTNDYYRFTLNQNSNFNLTLSGLSGDADVRLLDANGSNIASSTASGTTNEFINRQLNAGNYFIQVFPMNGVNTSYNLSVAATAIIAEPGNTLAAAEVRNSPIFSRNETVSAGDRHDFYRFNVTQSGIFTANLTNLSGDADVRLIHDRNNNGAIDQGEIIAWQWERGSVSESIRRFLNAGNYFLEVMSYNNQTANYSLSTNFRSAASDDQRFSIQINFGTGSEGLSSVMRNAVQEAARFWENVITHTNIKSNTLTIEVGGSVQQWDYSRRVLASAGPTYIQRDFNGRWIPISGVSYINTNPNAVSNLTSDVNYFRGVMIHEFGHVLGLGTLWDYERSLINRTNGTYNANTYAGWAYGELRRTYTQTAIPLTTGVGRGSDYGHWREEVFTNEIMTHAVNRNGMPLSQLTIASLRDIGWNVNYGAAEAYLMSNSTATQTVVNNSPFSTTSSFQISCGCAKHMAANGLNMVGSTSLESLINGHTA
jgi:hypothetical protein